MMENCFNFHLFKRLYKDILHRGPDQSPMQNLGQSGGAKPMIKYITNKFLDCP